MAKKNIEIPDAAEMKAMKTDTKPPSKPVFPPGRVIYEAFLLGELMFDSQEEFDAWKAEPWWRRWLGLTAYNRKPPR